MSTTQISLRIPDPLIKAIDRFAAQERTRTGDPLISRADVIRELLSAELNRRTAQRKQRTTKATKPNE